MQDLINGFKNNILDTLGPILKNKRCILMIYPGYPNGGDGLIWLGEIQLFKKLGVEIVSMFPDTRLDAQFINALDYEIILIQGGGNFGDIWPELNECRRKIISIYPNRKIIQLPVTIQFNDKDRLYEMQKAISSHDSFILTVRDNVSYEFAKANFGCEVYKIPDLAFYNEMNIFNMTPVKACRNGAFYFFRRDKESLFKTEGLKFDSKDWPDFQSEFFHLKDRLFCRVLFRDYFKLLPDNFGNLKAVHRVKAWIYGKMEAYHKKKFISQICDVINCIKRYEIVITDRLHVQILATLCGVPSILMPGAYHKNVSFYNTWMKENPIADICLERDELAEKITNLKNRAK